MALFVGRLNSAIRQRDLQELFAKFGNVSRCDLKGNFEFGYKTYHVKDLLHL